MTGVISNRLHKLYFYFQKMKKIIIGIVALIYLSLSSGMTVTMHYCMGKFAGIGFWHKNAEKCTICGMNKMTTNANGCCKDEHKQIKIEKDQKEAESTFQISPVYFATLSSDKFDADLSDGSFITNKNSLNHSLLRSRGLEVYILNCVFRL